MPLSVTLFGPCDFSVSPSPNWTFSFGTFWGLGLEFGLGGLGLGIELDKKNHSSLGEYFQFYLSSLSFLFQKSNNVFLITVFWVEHIKSRLILLRYSFSSTILRYVNIQYSFLRFKSFLVVMTEKNWHLSCQIFCVYLDLTDDNVSLFSCLFLGKLAFQECKWNPGNTSPGLTSYLNLKIVNLL